MILRRKTISGDGRMPTVFIAVQCCECSTMQVRQQKKSSNKWTCVVCNQKQSVRKVFAQGHKAKEIRLFVQNFNMSRQFMDQLGREEAETLDIGEQNQSHGDSKRTKWTEYLDPEETAIEKDEVSRDAMEPKVVTELPKELFGKPKLKNYFAVAGHFKPVFSKRNARKQSISQGQGYRNAQNTGVEPSKRQATMASVISKWGDNRTAPLDVSVQPATDSVSELNEGINLYDNDNYTNEGDLGYIKPVQRSQTKTANKVSKWNEYITEDEDDCHSQFASRIGSSRDVNKCSGNTIEISLKDQRLDDEEIHPDFL